MGVRALGSYGCKRVLAESEPGLAAGSGILVNDAALGSAIRCADRSSDQLGDDGSVLLCVDRGAGFLNEGLDRKSVV